MDDLNSTKLAIEKAKIDIKKADAFVQNYNPLNEFTEIVNMLEYVISSRDQKRRLQNYSNMVFEKFSNKITVPELKIPELNTMSFKMSK